MKRILLTAMTVSSLFAAEPFIKVDKLNAMLNDDNVVILDVSTKEAYMNEGHIPGALHAEISNWRMKVDKHQLMRPIDELEKHITALGIDNDDTVVLYGHNKPKELLKASYIALTFKALGHDDVTILDGGLNEWNYDADVVRPLSKKAESPKKGGFKAKPANDFLVDRAFVTANLHKLPMVEARPPQFYFGMLESKGVKRIGHIPGGMSYFWRNSFTEDELVKSSEQLHTMLVTGMGLDPEKAMMVYCTGGLEASMNWYVLTQVLGFKDVKMYDASLREWGNRDDTPMVAYRWEEYTTAQ